MKSWMSGFGFLFTLAISVSLAADEQLSTQTDLQKFSYTLGYQIGGQIASQVLTSGLELDPEAFAQAIADVLSARPPAISETEMELVLEKRQQKEQAIREVAAESGKKRGEAFQADYGERDDVIERASGLQYRVLEKGDGRSPGPEDTVVVHYTGRLIDGTEFDSSRVRQAPATFSLGGIIPGWQEVLQLMQEGDRWEIVIPSELAYGSGGAGSSIGPHETLIFEIELITVK